MSLAVHSSQRFPPLAAPLRVAFGIACYREAATIVGLLRHLGALELPGFDVVKIVVVSDVGDDGTDVAVESFSATSRFPVSLIKNATRYGKAAAVNCIIDNSDSDVIVMISADALPSPDCIAKLLTAFSSAKVGVVCARPVAHGPTRNLAVRITSFMYALHHWIALRRPKSTEIVAFRNFHEHIPENSLVDEAEIEAHLTRMGMTVTYEPEAVIFTNAPLKLREYFVQRTRVTTGHMHLRRSGYPVATLSLPERFRAIAKQLRSKPSSIFILVVAAIVEVLVYCVASFQFRFKKSDPRWAVSSTTKRPYAISQHRKNGGR